MKLGEPKPVRIEILKKKIDEAPLAHEPIEFRGEFKSFPVFSARIELPRYRLRNGRTIAAQEDLLAKRSDLPGDLFQDSESEQAQKEQHKLLMDLVKGTPLEKEMVKGKQKNALILNGEGIVINGNRRLAVMRHLLDKDPKRYSSYQHIRIAILPDADEKEIYEYEVKEQIRPETKEHYDWIGTAKMLKRGLEDLSHSVADLAKIHEMKQNDVTHFLDLLQAADEYLADRGMERQYSKVMNERFFFESLVKSRKKRKNEAEREALSELSYMLLENPPEGIGRLYSVVPSIEKNLEDILDAIEEEVDLPEATTSSVSGDESLELLGGTGESGDLVGRIVQAAAHDEKREDIITTVIDTVEHAAEQAKTEKKKGYVLKKVRTANRALHEAKVALGHESKRQGISDQLDEIEASVTDIRKWLAKNAKA